MQHTLTFVKDKVKYVSKPFDFEAMCIINDAHNDENKKGPLSICRDALDYMFEGTDATQDIIDSVDVNVQRCVLHFGGFTLTLFLQKTSNVRRQRGA